MKRIFTMIASLTIVMLGFAAPAAATQGETWIKATPGDCEATVIESGGEHVDNARVVVDDGTEVHVGSVGTTIEVGPFSEPTTVYYRIFGGGERDHDVPLWNGYGDADFKDDINKYAADNGGWGWTVAGTADENPFTNWKSVPTLGCVTPEEPTFTHPICERVDGEETTKPGGFVVPEVDGVIYKPAESGELDHGDKITIKAWPDEGYVFPDGKRYEKWSFLAVIVPCDGADGKDGSDGSDGADGKDGSDGKDGDDGKSIVTVDDVTPAASTSDTLPKTGVFGPVQLVVGALALMVLGGLLVAHGRRKARLHR